MENRYLFKAKRKNWQELPKDEQWVEGYLFDDGFENGRVFVGGFVIEKYNGTACDEWTVTGIDFYEIDQNTICQCTGLKDKNGKLIWENDIVKDERGNLYKAFWQSNYYQFSWVCVKSEIFQIRTKWDLWSIKSYEIEVIGNIFDNPKLLESEEK
jgi:uncharacterized phage protein (TIGR01671 family)|nr:MAG TPA: YopX protein [Bacteriophage sp.]